MNKPVLVISLAMIGILVIVAIIYSNTTSGSNFECTEASDCVPAQCCHPTSCVSKDKAPDCTDVMCTMECAPGTMDCGQGSCTCGKGVCSSIII